MSIEEIDSYTGPLPGVETSKYYGIIQRYAGVKHRHYALWGASLLRWG